MTDIWHIHTYGESWYGERHEFVSGDEKWVKRYVYGRYGQFCPHVTCTKITPVSITEDNARKLVTPLTHAEWEKEDQLGGGA